MMKWFSRKIMPAEDEHLRLFLKEHDPVAWPDPRVLIGLEADILERINGRRRPRAELDTGIMAAVFQQNWSLRGAMCASIFIMASGFIVGQITYGNTAAASFIGTPSLFALADETSWQATPITNGSLGDNDDNAE